MFGLFKKKPKEKQPPKLLDLNNNPIVAGAVVKSLRYDLGECDVILEEFEYFYVPRNGDNKVSYMRMIDAITENQKVLLLDSGGTEKYTA